jgi:hypothetical protein
MLPFRKILFPVDYSQHCLSIVPYVKEMVRHYSADLTLVHAYGPEAFVRKELDLMDPEILQKGRASEERRLCEFATETFPGVHADCIAELGEAGSVVHNITQHQGTDLAMLLCGPALVPCSRSMRPVFRTSPCFARWTMMEKQRW